MATQDTNEGRAVLVVGATGGVGNKLVRLLAEQGHRVSGLHRSDDDASSVSGAGGEPVKGDLVEDTADALAERMRHHDAVVFAAGAGGGSVADVDRDGAKKAVDAAQSAGVRRFVLVSVFMDAWRGEESPGEGFEQYVQAKRAADVHLAASQLDFLIVRPGTLADDDGSGGVNAGTSVAYDTIPRQDVAAFIAAALFSPGLNRVAIELTGGSVPIAESVAGLQASAYAVAGDPA